MSQAAKDREKRRQLYAIAIVAIIALLGINVWLMMSNKGKTEVIEQQEVQLDKADELRQQLEEEYQEAMAQLEAKATENDDLREVVDQQKSQLTALKKKIERNIARGVNTTSLLKEAQAQIQVLVTQKDGYIVAIDSLVNVNADLVDYIEVVKTEKVNLEETIVQKDEVITQVETAKKEVEEEKEKLATKVARGGVLAVREINVEPFRFKKNGNVAPVRRAKNVEKFNICFDVIKNELTEPGRNKFLVRIINPIGETIAVEARGSGTFSNQDDGGTSMRFTTSKSIEYGNDEPNICIEWIQEEKLANKGDYTFEVYNRGYLAGKKVLTMK